eukprot:GHVS01080196.1.p1 GENE.GHVS01080196.1~~GHVS01080196.1.p1  ORF type:complete len:171 (+),score=53.16 GHVS01080196.1:2-514(+)
MRDGFYYSLDVNPSSKDSTAHHALIAFLYILCPTTTTTTSSNKQQQQQPTTTTCVVLVIVNFCGDCDANGFVKLRCGCGTQTPLRTTTTATSCPIPIMADNNNNKSLSAGVRKCLVGGGEFGNGEVVNILLSDKFGTVEAYARSLREFEDVGIWFNVKPWGTHVFDITPL